MFILQHRGLAWGRAGQGKAEQQQGVLKSASSTLGGGTEPPESFQRSATATRVVPRCRKDGRDLSQDWRLSLELARA